MQFYSTTTVSLVIHSLLVFSYTLFEANISIFGNPSAKFVKSQVHDIGPN